MKLHDTGVYLVNGAPQTSAPAGVTEADAKKGTIAYGILKAHNTGDSMQDLRMKFDSMTSHDITYVGIIQTARASGMTEFPLPYVMTNCHNSLCAVGGTINEDDHQFALSAAHKYGGIYVPPNMAVIHSYNREMMSGCGRMILGSDSHTRYGALGTMAVGEGGGELAKQLVGRTYDMSYPGVVAIYLTGKPAPGVGPHDVALALVAATYANGYVKNKVMEFVGPGVANLSADYRNGIDVMTTETTCWSSIWQTDDTTKEYFVQHGRPEAYKELKPADVAYYDGCIELDLSTVECMIALPMHPSYAYPIRELKANAKEILQAAQDQANRSARSAAMAASTLTRALWPAAPAARMKISAPWRTSSKARAAATASSSSASTPTACRPIWSWSKTVLWRILSPPAASSASASAAPASARATPRPTASSPSATRPATSRTARAPSPARARSAPSP